MQHPSSPLNSPAPCPPAAQPTSGLESKAVFFLICASLLIIKLSIWNLAILWATSKLGDNPEQSATGSWRWPQRAEEISSSTARPGQQSKQLLRQETHWAAEPRCCHPVSSLTKPRMLQSCISAPPMDRWMDGWVDRQIKTDRYRQTDRQNLPPAQRTQRILNAPEPGRRMAFAIICRCLMRTSSPLRLVCAAPIKCERLANTRPCNARAPWVGTGWNLLPGAQLILHTTAKPACCTTAVRQSFVWQYFEQRFWSCWRGMRVLSLEMDRILFHLHSKAGLWRIRSNYKPQGPNL